MINREMVNTNWRRVRASGVFLWVAAVLAGLLVRTALQTNPPLLLAGAAAGLLFFVLFLERPDLGLFFVLIVRSFSDLSAMGRSGGTAATFLQPNVGLSILIIVGGALFILSHRIPFLSLPGGTILVLLLLNGAVGMMRAESLFYSLYHWLRVASNLFPYAMAAYMFRTRQKIHRVIDVLAVAFMVPALYGLWQFVTRHGYYQEGYGLRVQGTFVHPNAFGIFLVVFFAIFFCQARVQSGARKLVATVIVGTALLLIAMTYARVAWVGAFVVMATVGIFTRRPAVLLLPILAFAAVFTVPSLSHRGADFTTIFQPGGGGSLQGRYDIWHGAFSQWITETNVPDSNLATVLNRVVGMGPGATGFLTRRGYGEVYAAHNDYLELLLTYGVFGLLMYLLMFGALLVSAFRTWKATRDPLMRAIPLSFHALLLAVLAMSLTDNIFEATQNQLYVWTLAGLTVAVRRMSVENPLNEPEGEQDLRNQRYPALARRGAGSSRLSPRRGLVVR